MDYIMSHEVSRLSGVPFTTLCRWARQGLLTPTGGGCQGRDWLWERKHVREASIIRALRQAGLSMQKLRECFEYLRRRLGHNPASTGTFLVVTGRDGRPRDIVKLCSSGEAIALLDTHHRGQLVFRLAEWEGAA